jgi:hypothetical protein
MSSPGIGAATSAFVAPQRICHGLTNGVTAHIGTADSVSAIKAIFALRELTSDTS